MKKISEDELLSLINSSYVLVMRQKITTRLGRHYCTRMANIRQCSGTCAACKNHVNAIFEKMQPRPGQVVRDPLALLVWACREVAAEIAENLPKGAPRTDALGQVLDENPFSALLEEIQQAR